MPPTDSKAGEINDLPHVHTGLGASNHDQHGVTFWIGLVIGTAVVAFGVRGALMAFDTFSERFVYVKYLIGFDFIHDLIIAPAAFLVGYILHRLVPARFKAPLAFALFTTAISTAVAWYPLQHSAGYKGNASFQPLNYASALFTVLAVVWVIAGVWAVIVSRSRRDQSAAQ